MSDAPDLLYFGDVPVEETSAGRLFLHRLVSACEPGRWALCSSNFEPGNPSAPRPPSALRTSRRHRGLRLLKLGPMWARILVWREWHAPSPWPISRPRAVLTVAHGFGWIGAVSRARRLGVRCVVHVHDHPGASLPGAERHWRWYASWVRRALRASDVTLAANPLGAEWLTEQTGRIDPVVFSVWADDAPPVRPPVTPRRTPVLGYAGSIAYSGYRPGIIVAAEAVRLAGWRMVVFPSSPPDEALRAAAPNIEWRETVPAAELPGRLAEAADLAFITTDFEPSRREHVRVACPAKLADYAYAGLPILAMVPDWSSLSRVAKDNPDLLQAVTERSPSALAAALKRHSEGGGPDRERMMAAARRVLGLRENVRVLREALRL